MLRKLLVGLVLVSSLAFAQTTTRHAGQNTNNNFTGDNTFTKPVVVATPTGPTHAATKAYVDGQTAGTATSAFSLGIPQPEVADSGKYQHKLTSNFAITQISCSTDQGTASINLDVRVEALPNVPGTQVLASPLVCNSTTATAPAILSPNVTANSPIAVLISGTSGTPGVVRIHVSIQYQ
jgi:hypothetical protein